MCELFAMNAEAPTEVGAYLASLKPRGGLTGPHADGWGVAYYEDRASRIFKDSAPAADSIYLSLLAEHGFKSSMVLAHIRKANPSVFGRATANTHPFEREWRGKSWVFAHNGKLPGLKESGLCANSRFQPVGDTDSELVFCYLMELIAQAMETKSLLEPTELVDTLRPTINSIADMGEFNFILSDGSHLFAHAHTNLYVLQKDIPLHGGSSSATYLATQPLTEESWLPLPASSLHVFTNGMFVSAAKQFPWQPELEPDVLAQAYA